MLAGIEFGTLLSSRFLLHILFKKRHSDLSRGLRRLDQIRCLLCNTIKCALQMRADLHRENRRIYHAYVRRIVHHKLRIHHTTKSLPHHRCSTDGVRDAREPVGAWCGNPHRPVRVRPIHAVIRNGLEARDSLTRGQFTMTQSGCEPPILNEFAHLNGAVLNIFLDKRAPAIWTVRSHGTLK